MKKMLVPLVLAVIGTGGGVAAAMFLAPGGDAQKDAEQDPAKTTAECPPTKAAGDDADHSEYGDADHGDDHDTAGQEFVKINNQFVVPVVENDRVDALVILSISLAVAAGQTSEVYQAEPKLRDAFLSVLFEHANSGHFGPGFTQDNSLRLLKRGLRDVARNATGGTVQDVLITEIARQEA